MSTKEEADQLLDQIEFLLEKYSEELRACTQPYVLSRVQEFMPEYVYKPADEIVRESLIEHVGSLPILATAFYPYINDAEVDLGKALTMLAIHDIGELVTHDESTFTKKAESQLLEQEEALKLLHPSYHDLYIEMETLKSKTAQFAKSIDKIAPDIYDLLTPVETTFPRFKHFVGIEPDQIISLIVKHKRPYMQWNPFMTEFHTVLMTRLADKLGQVREL